ncbi:YHYH protein [Algicola sagamiensis]|uniref:YHYH protein n=1 Tax=Algicola sagamiensis TaxID=163869 RepID=UPI00035DB420|nr:YHYH protein [Algicola sagamiensis]
MLYFQAGTFQQIRRGYHFLLFIVSTLSPNLFALEVLTHKQMYIDQLMYQSSSIFTEMNLVESAQVVSCELRNGQHSWCYQLKFHANQIEDGPYCFENSQGEVGLYYYDGVTNPGLKTLIPAFFEDMEKDGYDILDEQGKVRFVMLGGGGDPIDPKFKYCLEAKRDDALITVYQIPIFPRYAKAPTPIDDAGIVFAVSANGIPLNGPPPSVVLGPGKDRGPASGNVPAVDHCGGHVQPAGFYHFHYYPQTMNRYLQKNGIYTVTCDEVKQRKNMPLGIALDGYPIYAERDIFGKRPEGLDECHGHFGATRLQPLGVYHYHAVNTAIPNTVPCLKGELSTASFSLE